MAEVPIDGETSRLVDGHTRLGAGRAGPANGEHRPRGSLPISPESDLG